MKKGSNFSEQDLKKMGLIEKNGMYVKNPIKIEPYAFNDGTKGTIAHVSHPLFSGVFEGDIKIDPMPNSRPRFNGITRTAYNKPEYIAYKKALVILLLEQRIPKMDWKKVECTFFYAFTKGMKQDERYEGKPRRVRPDSDNLGKAILDAMEDAKVFKDDGQIHSMLFNKQYTFGAPHIHFKLIS